jgi:uncharacterized protein DUF1549/uncharacterized protein DUF1553
MRLMAFLALSTLLALSGRWASGEDAALAPDSPPEQAIDHYIGTRLQQVGVSPAPEADDANLLRRTMLDLVGRPPTAGEAKVYIECAEPGKRRQLVERLLASPAFVRQQAAELDAWLMEGTKGSIREYLARAIRDHRSWDRMFREMIVGEPDDVRQQGAIRYVAARAKDPDKLTSDTSVLFFGVNVSCAKCHDHPLVDDWKQDHYYGMLSFFSRTFDVGEFLGEREYGRVSFKTVDGQSRDARLMFLTGATIDEPLSQEPDDKAKKEEKKRIDELRQKKEPPPPPSYSRRAALVEAALHDEQQGFFAKAIVNRLFLRFFGRGLVMPADQMHSENPPSHPELLAWLAHDLQTHGYDLNRLIRGIVLSEAYARSSRWESSAARPAESLFAVALVRPLKPWQYGTLLKLATTDEGQFPASMSAEELDTQIERIEAAGRALTATLELPGVDFQVSVDEALLLSNGDKMAKDLLAADKGTLTGKLAEISDNRAAAETAMWNILARPPSSEEVEALADYLARRADRPAEARRQMVWALLTSGECRFNY